MQTPHASHSIPHCDAPVCADGATDLGRGQRLDVSLESVEQRVDLCEFVVVDVHLAQQLLELQLEEVRFEQLLRLAQLRHLVRGRSGGRSALRLL